MYPSKIGWIERGLEDFVKTYKRYNIKSVAFTKLGTLNGGLDWNEVKVLMEKYLNNLNITVYVCLDEKKEAEGLEKQMLDVFYKLTDEELKNNIKLKGKQLEILMQSKQINRFWKIKEIKGIGLTTYKSLFNYCKTQVESPVPKQMSIFDCFE